MYAKELARWAEKDWPVIVRRVDLASAPNAICLGLALPPDAGTGRKTRIPFAAGIDEIARHDAPLDLAEAGLALPPAWRQAYSDLSVTAANRQLEFRVYGSVAMQATTGLSYLTAASDIDLLLYPRMKTQLQQGMHVLSVYAERLPLDGEIVFPSGRAVAWKEWAHVVDAPDSIRVLAKSMQAVKLVPAADLLAELE